MDRKARTREKYKAVRSRYKEMKDMREEGIKVQKLNEAFILKKLAQEFFYSPATIEAIVYFRVKED